MIMVFFPALILFWLPGDALLISKQAPRKALGGGSSGAASRAIASAAGGAGVGVGAGKDKLFF